MGRFILVVTLLGCVALSMSRVAAQPLASPTPLPTVSPTAIPGWPGSNAQYLGRYRLTKSNNKRWAHTGQLTVFMRTIRAGLPVVMSGILSLYGKRSTIFYLTQFAHTDADMEATVNLGSYAGPVIGKFVVKQIKGKTMTAAVTIQGIPKLNLRLLRFSKNPQP